MEEEVFRLQKELRDRNEDLYRAGTVGNELLEKTRVLSKQLECIESENEVLKQDKYSLQLDLEAQIKTNTSHALEIESQREEFDKLVKKLEELKKENQVYKQQKNNLTREKFDSEQTLDDVQRENQTLKLQIDSLKNQVQVLQMKAEASINLEVVEKESDSESSVDFYKCKNKQLNEALAEIHHELESVKSTEKQLKKMVEELEEGIRDRDKELSTYSVELQKAKEHASELEGEMELLKLEQIDINRKGNSVFGEIDDRRKIIEKEYKLLAKKYENLGQRYVANKKELVSCKDQLAILFSMTSRKYQDDYIEKLETQLNSAKMDVENLTNKLLAMVRNKETQNIVVSGSGEYDYLKFMHEEDEKKLKRMENKMMELHLRQIADSETVSTIREELYDAQKQLDATKMENMKLHQKIKELTLFKEPEELTTNKEEVAVREFDPNKSQYCNQRDVSEEGEKTVTVNSSKETASQDNYLTSYIKENAKPVMKPNNTINMGLGDDIEPRKEFGHSKQLKENRRMYTNKERKEPQCAQQ